VVHGNRSTLETLTIITVGLDWIGVDWCSHCQVPPVRPFAHVTRLFLIVLDISQYHRSKWNGLRP